PGAHRIALALEVLAALREGRRTPPPPCDRLADAPLPPRLSPRVDDAALVLFEPGFPGTPAETAAAPAAPPTAPDGDEGGDRRWRRWCNDALARDYPALWRRIGRLLLLLAPGFEVVPGWRCQAEQAMPAARPGMPAMDRAAFARFMQHYERVSRQALRTLP